MPRNRDNEDVENDILKNIAGDDADDQAQLLDNEDDDIQFADDADDNEPDEDDDHDRDERHDLSDDDADDDDDEPQRRPTEPVDKRQKPSDADRNEKFQFAEDKQGNFVDKDGNIIVKAGKSRDIFVKIKKAYLAEQRKVSELSQVYTETVAQARELLKRYEDLKANKTLAEQHGLSAEEHKQAVELAVLNRIDPKGCVKKILTIAHMNGIDLKDLGITGPVDAKTVAEMMLAKQKEEAAAQVKTPEQEAREEADAFFGRHPAAKKYTGMVAEAKTRFPHMTLDEIWFEILLNAKMKQQPHQKEENREENKREERRPPNRPIPRNQSRATTSVVNGKLSLKAVDPSQSFKDIGKQLLRDIRAVESRE